MCTRALWAREGQPVLVGRNMDWTERMDTRLRVMPRGIRQDGRTEDSPLSWTSKYGSLVATVWDSAVCDGINEKGFTARLLYLAESVFADRDSTKPGLSVSLWTQYCLDNFASVKDALAALDEFQLRPFPIVHQAETVQSPVHLSIADATGDSAIIEILGGKAVVHHGKQYYIMTNSPTYDKQLMLAKEYEGLGGRKPLPGTIEPEDRFVRAAYYTKNLPEPEDYSAAVAGLLSVMRNASAPFGYNDPERPNVSPTIWRSISDLTNRVYYFEFTTMPNLVWVDLNKLDLSEGAGTAILDLRKRPEISGEVSKHFEPAELLAYAEAN